MMADGFDAATARRVVSEYGPRLDLATHPELVEAAIARVSQLNRELTDLRRMVGLVEAELIALHQLALWVQRTAELEEVAEIADLAGRTLI